MIEDMTARKLKPHTQCGDIYGCKPTGAWLRRSPDTATRRRCAIQLYLIERTGICNRDRIIAGSARTCALSP